MNTPNISDQSVNFDITYGLGHSSLSIPELQPNHFIYENVDNQHQIIIFPTLHNQVGFSKIAEILITNLKIDCVATELPWQLEDELDFALNRLPVPSIIHPIIGMDSDEVKISQIESSYIVHPGESIFWLAYVSKKKNIPVKYLDYWLPNIPIKMDIPIDFAKISFIGWRKFFENGYSSLKLHYSQPIHIFREKYMVKGLLDLSKTNKITIFICGAAHYPFIDYALKKNQFSVQSEEVIPDTYKTVLDEYYMAEFEPPTSHHPIWSISDIHPTSLHLHTGDLPYLLNKFIEDPLSFELLEAIRYLFFDSETIYHSKFDDNISPANYQRLFQYLRNMNRLKAELIPDLYSLVIAAKGMVDDDYAYEVFRNAIDYRFRPNPQNKLDREIRLIPDPDQSNIIKLAFRRRYKRPILKKFYQDNLKDEFDPIPEEDYPGQWREIWDELSKNGYVSYPPEDVFIEKYFNYLRRRLNEIIMEEKSTTIPFRASLEDGIDWKATTRFLHENKIFVKQLPRTQSEFGAIVVQFVEEEKLSMEYNYHSTLFAEHELESHISVVTTKPGDEIIGPGITRVKYAAIVSQFPPNGWPILIPQTIDDFKIRLIYTAMRMALTKIIGYISEKPPTIAQINFASTNGFRLIYLPMGQLTKSSLHRLRTMHLLADRSIRDLAREYIGF